MTDPEPRIIIARAGYLALSDPHRYPNLRIGVMGATEQEARDAFRREVDAWHELRRRRTCST